MSLLHMSYAVPMRTRGRSTRVVTRASSSIDDYDVDRLVKQNKLNIRSALMGRKDFLTSGIQHLRQHAMPDGSERFQNIRYYHKGRKDFPKKIKRKTWEEIDLK